MTTTPEPGDRIHQRWRKWDGSPHWIHERVYLGSDEWGHWVGQDVGWGSERPGASEPAAVRIVSLVPPSGTEVASFLDEPASQEVYIDLAWDVRFDGAEPTGIDMDLDVILARDDRGLWIDDEDEFAEHAVEFGYPAEVVHALEARAAELLAQVRDRRAPYDGATAARWLARLGEILDGAQPDGRAEPADAQPSQP